MISGSEGVGDDEEGKAVSPWTNIGALSLIIGSNIVASSLNIGIFQIFHLQPPFLLVKFRLSTRHFFLLLQQL